MDERDALLNALIEANRDLKLENERLLQRTDERDATYADHGLAAAIRKDRALAKRHRQLCQQERDHSRVQSQRHFGHTKYPDLQQHVSAVWDPSSMRTPSGKIDYLELAWALLERYEDTYTVRSKPVQADSLARTLSRHFRDIA